MASSVNKIIFNIGKQILKQITEPIPTIKVEYVTLSECTGESCMFYNSEDEHAKTYCASFCPKAHVVKPIIKRIINFNSFSGPILNAKGKFTPRSLSGNIHSFITKIKIDYKNKIRLSLNQIKQMLTLYSFCDSNGIIKSISKKQIASVIGCTEKTVENNNILLSKIGFISIFPREKGELSIIISKYKEQHQKNGGGYIVMSNYMLSLLMELKNVNALRLAIPAIINYDMNSIVNRATKFSTKEIKTLLPSYIYTRKAITKIIDTFSSLSKHIFTWKEEDNVFIVDIDRSLDGKTIKKESTIVFETEIIGAISEKFSGVATITQEVIKDKLSIDIEDLVSMGFEYGIDIVKSFCVKAFSIKETIRSFGAYVRQLICNFYSEGGKLNIV
ncbi:hypothetical protein [Clostridium sp. FP1]|uniref:hypothetical protein n=1 Tax=Clostridium sp. FP1 TaxID=2724076 RepID=UPI0013E94E38|nr:hypothetical protein [Clostridium sp. FP1]MBZ9637616.1 hypothetical protein [Clostridium sp. FP1]